MRGPKLLPVLGLVLGVWGTGLVASAGVVIEQEQREPGNPTPLRRTTFYLDAGRLRIESKSAEGEDTVTIFDEAKQVVWVVDRAAGTYTELTAAKVREMQQRMEEARKQMDAQLAQMPPERRRMIEEMMKLQMGSGAATTVREVGREEKVGPYTCIRYEQISQGQRVGEFWAAPLDQLQLGEPEYKTFQTLTRFLEPLGGAGARLVSGGREIQGFPVRSLTYEGQQVVAEETVAKAERRRLDAGLFQLPPGLTKSEFELE